MSTRGRLVHPLDRAGVLADQVLTRAAPPRLAARHARDGRARRRRRHVLASGLRTCTAERSVRPVLCSA